MGFSENSSGEGRSEERGQQWDGEPSAGRAGADRAASIVDGPSSKPPQLRDRAAGGVCRVTDR